MKRAIIIILVITAVLLSGYLLFRRQIYRASYHIVSSISEKICRSKGGVRVLEGCDITANCFYSCSMPYSDGGKECTNSSQCSHHCIVPDENVKSCLKISNDKFDCSNLMLVGSCEKVKAGNCEYRWELNNGVVSSIVVSCELG